MLETNGNTSDAIAYKEVEGINLLAQKMLEFGIIIMTIFGTFFLILISPENVALFICMLFSGLIGLLFYMYEDKKYTISIIGYMMTWFYWTVYSFGYFMSFGNVDNIVNAWPLHIICTIVIYCVPAMLAIRNKVNSMPIFNGMFVLMILFTVVPFKGNNTFYIMWKSVCRTIAAALVFFLMSYYQKRCNDTREFVTRKTVMGISYIFFGQFEISIIILVVQVGFLCYFIMNTYPKHNHNNDELENSSDESSSDDDTPVIDLQQSVIEPHQQ